MHMTRVLGICLIVGGLALALSGSQRFTTKETVVDVGPVEITRDRSTALPAGPILGGVVIVVGLALVVLGRKGA